MKFKASLLGVLLVEIDAELLEALLHIWLVIVEHFPDLFLLGHFHRLLQMDFQPYLAEAIRFTLSFVCSFHVRINDFLLKLYLILISEKEGDTLNQILDCTTIQLLFHWL